MAEPASEAAGQGRREVILGSMLMAAAGGAAVMAPPHPAAAGPSAAAFDAAIPSRMGDYRRQIADEIVLPDRDVDSLTLYQQYVARTYAAPGGPPITLLIAYGAAQDYALQIHRPESCYPAAGFTLGPPRVVELPGTPAIAAVTLTAQRLDRNDRLLYWTRVGDAFPVTLWRQRRAMLRQLLERRPVDGVLVRLSMPDAGGASLMALARFNALLLATASPLARQLLLG